MLRLHKSIWEHLFGSDTKPGRTLPGWLVPPVRFGYLVIQEFSRNRCPEKASALGFQPVFSLIPAFALALFFFRAFDFSNLGGKVEPVLYRILKIDKIYLAKEEPEENKRSDTDRQTPPDDARREPDSKPDSSATVDPELPRLDA